MGDEWLRVVRQGDGLVMEEARVLLARGWVCVPKVSIRHGGKVPLISVPGQEPLMGIEVVDLWYKPHPSVPRGAVIAVVQELAKVDVELVYVEFLARHLLGMTVDEVLSYGK